MAAAVTRSLRDVGYRLPVELGANRKKWVWGRLHALRFEPLWRRGGGDSLGPFALGSLYDWLNAYAAHDLWGKRKIREWMRAQEK